MAKAKFWYWISLVGFLLTAGSFLLMEGYRLGVLPGILFWAGLLLGGSGQLVLSAQRKKKSIPAIEKIRLPGCLRFFSNRKAKWADIAMMILIPATVLVLALSHGIGYQCFLFLAAAFLSIVLHSILNGKNYEYVKYAARRRRYSGRRAVKKQVREENQQ